MADLTARQATRADIEDWYEGPSPGTVKAYVVLLDGRVAGIAGLVLPGLRGGKIAEAFSDMAAELAPYLRHPVVQAAIGRVIRLIRKSKFTVIAVADPNIPTSETLLQRLGAERVGRISDGEVYQWKQ
jgi:hypothetical protein